MAVNQTTEINYIIEATSECVVCLYVRERGRYPVNQAYVTPLCESGATYAQYI